MRRARLSERDAGVTFFLGACISMFVSQDPEGLITYAENDFILQAFF